MSHHGKFRPINLSKYVGGDPLAIEYRSSWECRIMKYLDNNPSVLAWNYEGLRIPYFDPSRQKRRNYIPDFYVKYKTKDGKIKEAIWEVKPRHETIEPRVKKRKTKKYIYEVLTYGTNQAKWQACQEYCMNKGWGFTLITEKELGL